MEARRLLTGSGNFRPERRDGCGGSLSRIVSDLATSSVDLHVFGDPFDAHELRLLHRLLAYATRITETVRAPLSSVHQLPGATQVYM